VRLEGLGQLKESNDLIGNRTRDLPACSIVQAPRSLHHNFLRVPSRSVQIKGFVLYGHHIRFVTLLQ
jgi:hypothetical protein